jgi:hypothetical protein
MDNQLCCELKERSLGTGNFLSIGRSSAGQGENFLLRINVMANLRLIFRQLRGSLNSLRRSLWVVFSL